MKHKILIYFVVSLFLSVFSISVKISAFSSSYDGNVFVYEDDEKIYLKNFNNDSIIFISNGKMPTISSDGRFIVFSSTKDKRICPSLLEQSQEFCVDIIIYDRLNETFENITENFDNHSYSAVISSNSKYLVIETLASNIEGLNSSCQSYNETKNRSCSNIISLDLQSKKINIITNNTSYDSFDPKVSKDGTHIVFRSFHPFSKDGKKYCYNDYYKSTYYCSTIYYYKDKTITKVSSGKADAYNALISENGKYITYQSYDIEVENYHHYYNTIYRFDTKSLKKTLITNNSNRLVENTFISEDGNLSGFLTEATNIINDDNFSLKYIIYNNKTKLYKMVKNDINNGINNSNGKYSFYLKNQDIIREKYNDITIEILGNAYFLINSNYDLTKNIKIPDGYNYRIIDMGNFSINIPGQYQITIEVFNNDSSSLYTYEVYVLEKDDPPVFNGSSSYKIKEGNISFSLSKEIEVVDQIDGKLTYQVVNDDGFNIYTPGKYNVVLKSTDSSQNVVYKTITLEVCKKNENRFLSFISSLILFGGLAFYLYFSSKKSHCS